MGRLCRCRWSWTATILRLGEEYLARKLVNRRCKQQTSDCGIEIHQHGSTHLGAKRSECGA
eukprot:240664-Prorocentrum_minimum.AAC.2